MKIAVGTDHGGYELKQGLIRELKSQGHAVQDFGTFSPAPCDYPLIGAKVGQAVSRGRADRGLLLCRSGAGMAIVANKFPGVRAAVCQTVSAATHSREHNDTNVLVLGADQLNLLKSKAILKGWLATSFAGGRHARRVHQIELIERKIAREKCSNT